MGVRTFTPTGIQAIDALLARAFTDDGAWPLAVETPIHRALNLYSAFAEGNKTLIHQAARTGKSLERYRLDGLAESIVDAWAAYLFGESTQVKPSNEGDAARLERLLGRNYASDLEMAARMSSAEGEVWGRVVMDPIIVGRPRLTWHSRRDVFPYYVNGELRAAATVVHLKKKSPQDQSVWRLFECHAEGIVINKLFKGQTGKLGVEVPLEAHPALAQVTERWNFGRPSMLLRRIPARISSDKTLGVSDIGRVIDQLFDLNAAMTAGASNMRLSARQRAVVQSSILQPAETIGLDLNSLGTGQQPPKAKFDPDEEIMVADPLNSELGGSTGDPYKLIDAQFDAQPLILWHRYLALTAINRVGLTAQYVGLTDPEAGYAISGTAMRMRFIPQTKSGNARGRYWHDELPRLILAMAQVDSLPVENMGGGIPWADTVEPPTIVLGEGMPVDEVEQASISQMLRGVGLESIETGLRRLHPTWTDEQIGEEVDAIRKDEAAKMPGGIGSMIGV
jgi:hypothetical protein